MWNLPFIDYQEKYQVINYLYMPVDQPVKLKVIVILTKRINECLGNLEPAKEESKLNGEKEGIEEI